MFPPVVVADDAEAGRHVGVVVGRVVVRRSASHGGRDVLGLTNRDCSPSVTAIEAFDLAS